MGALRTGGQGSVYRGRRRGAIFSAVKLLPTPIYTESNDDKNFRDFQNEVSKLRKVNEEPNPHVVKILNSGLTDSGGFPFIEMEFIEGPDLEDLIKPPHDTVFSIKETIKLADQLSHALAHCHKVDVKHGDIKSNNVKFNIHSGNYMLLDFGLSIMSDEQRRTSLRHAGAIEFMAPEQSEGLMLFETDVYSFGIVLYELLAGRVPFPLLGNGETARNNVMISHMETPVPDIMSLRRENLPSGWTDEKLEHEMQVPRWLLNVIAKCLEKKPGDRYKNGMELHEAIVMNSTLAIQDETGNENNAGSLQYENERLHKLVMQHQQAVNKKEQQLSSIKEIIAHRDSEIDGLKGKSVSYMSYNKVRLPKATFLALLILLVSLSAFTGYSILSGKKRNNIAKVSGADSLVADTTALHTQQIKNNKEKSGVQQTDSLSDGNKGHGHEKKGKKNRNKGKGIKGKFIEIKFY